MKYEDLMSIMNKKKNGTFFGCTWERKVKTLKGIDNNITKEVHATVRKGIDRKNLKKYKENPESYSNGPLPWGKWENGQEGLIIAHTTNNGENKKYIRLYTTKNKPKVRFFVNGIETSKERISSMVQRSELKSLDDADFFTLDVEKIKDIK